MNKKTFDALDRILGTMTYIYEDQREDAVMADITVVRDWMQEVDKEIEPDIL